MPAMATEQVVNKWGESAGSSFLRGQLYSGSPPVLEFSAHLSADPAAAEAGHFSLNPSHPWRVCDVVH